MGSHVLLETGIRRLGSKESGFFYRTPRAKVHPRRASSTWTRAALCATARASYISPRVIDHYLEGSVVAYHAEHLEEVMVAEQGSLTTRREIAPESAEKEAS